jgi:hypothetical protein
MRGAASNKYTKKGMKNVKIFGNSSRGRENV